MNLLLEWLFDTIQLGPYLEAVVSGNGILLAPEQPSADTQGWTQIYGNDHWGAANSGSSWAGKDFNGWAFIDPVTWKESNVGESEQYRYWSLGNDVIIVADSDEYADGTPGDNSIFESSLVSPAINLTTVNRSLVISFNENYRYDGTQQAKMFVQYDGGADVEIPGFPYTSDSGFSTSDPNLSIFNKEIHLIPPEEATSMRIKWYYRGENNWWWAIDNIKVQQYTPDPSTGSVNWEYDISANVTSGAVLSPGGTRLFHIAQDGILYAFWTADGSLLWSYDTGAPSDSYSAVTPDENMVFIGHDQLGKVIAIDMNGQLVWEYIGDIAVSTGLSSPRLSPDGQTLYIGTDTDVYALQTDSSALTEAQRLSWQNTQTGMLWGKGGVSTDGLVLYLTNKTNSAYALNTSDGTIKWNVALGSDYGYAPAVGINAIYIGTRDGSVYALSTTDGSTLWQYQKPAEGGDDIMFQATLSPAGGTIYVGAEDGYMYAINTADGTLKWRFLTTASEDISGKPIVSDGAVSAASDLVFFGSYDNYMYAVWTHDGSLAWKYLTGGQVWSSPALESTNHHIYFGSHDGKVYSLYTGLETIAGPPSESLLYDNTSNSSTGGQNVYGAVMTRWRNGGINPITPGHVISRVEAKISLSGWYWNGWIYTHDPAWFTVPVNTPFNELVGNDRALVAITFKMRERSTDTIIAEFVADAREMVGTGNRPTMWIDGTEDFCYPLPERTPPVHSSWNFVDSPIPGIIGGLDHGSYEIFITNETNTNNPAFYGNKNYFTGQCDVLGDDGSCTHQDSELYGKYGGIPGAPATRVYGWYTN